MKQQLSINASDLKAFMFGAPSAAVLCASSPMSAMSAAPAISAVAAWEAMAAVRPEFGRTTAAAHAWDINGGAPSSQAYLCTIAPASDALSMCTTATTALVNKANKTKTNKRPSSWSGSPNG